MNGSRTRSASAWGILADEAFLRRHKDVFAGEITFRNTREDVLRFPFPFETDVYETKVGIERHDRQGPTAAFHSYFDIDRHYHAMVAARAVTLAKDPRRYQSLPHMADTQWEAMVFMMENLSLDFPQHFTFTRDGAQITWVNRLLEISHQFQLGDSASLPDEPFAYITRQMQGDFILLDQRHDTLFMDVAMVTEAFYWSVDFIFGLDWMALHGPVQGERERETIERAHRMAMIFGASGALRRVNWGTQTRPRLDMSMENRIAGFGDEMRNLAQDFILRTEFQQLYRLPQSNNVLFCLRNYMVSVQDLLAVPKWSMRLHRVLRDFSPQIERFPSLAYRQEIVDLLAPFDDGRLLSRGRAPDIEAMP